jgi:tetratricopeptide (TPR) repeat protein
VKRARLRRSLGSERHAPTPFAVGPEFDAALADYAAAIEISPDDEVLRFERAKLLMLMNSGVGALKDADFLTARQPRSVRFQALRGDALGLLGRHQEAIDVYTHALPLTQSCAEASLIQRQVNEYRPSHDPLLDRSLTKEQLWEHLRTRPLYDVPEPSVGRLGFPCVPSAANKFEDLVLMKSVLLERRGDSYRALGNTSAALADYEHAVRISSLREFGSLSLCELEIELKYDYSAVETCRRAFDFSAYAVHADAARAAKIGTFLLEDGDIKGACRIAFPLLPNQGLRAYYAENADIDALQQRVKRAMAAIGMTSCERRSETR